MGVLYGYVRSADSGLGIPRVRLTIKGATGIYYAETNSEGFYSVNLPDGFYTVFIRERDLEPVTEGVNVVGKTHKDFYVSRIIFSTF